MTMVRDKNVFASFFAFGSNDSMVLTVIFGSIERVDL
jgi:hypothetical protein